MINELCFDYAQQTQNHLLTSMLQRQSAAASKYWLSNWYQSYRISDRCHC